MHRIERQDDQGGQTHRRDCAPWEAQAAAVGDCYSHAEREFEHDRIGPEVESDAPRADKLPERDEGEQRSRRAEHRVTLLQPEETGEDEVEEHFVFERPTEREYRTRRAVKRARPGQEGERRGDFAERWSDRAAGRSAAQSERQEERRREPIERNDAGDSPSQELSWAIRRREQSFRRIDHDETRDDEK